MEEHSEGLCGRVRREAEREHVGEGHYTEGEQQEDYDSCWVVKIECQEEDDCRRYRDVKFKRIEDEVSDPIRAEPHARNDLNMLELSYSLHDKVTDRESYNDRISDGREEDDRTCITCGLAPFQLIC